MVAHVNLHEPADVYDRAFALLDSKLRFQKRIAGSGRIVPGFAKRERMHGHPTVGRLS
jgi:hypothetical protein